MIRGRVQECGVRGRGTIAIYAIAVTPRLIGRCQALAKSKCVIDLVLVVLHNWLFNCCIELQLKHCGICLNVDVFVIIRGTPIKIWLVLVWTILFTSLATHFSGHVINKIQDENRLHIYDNLEAHLGNRLEVHHLRGTLSLTKILPSKIARYSQLRQVYERRYTCHQKY